MNDEMKNATMLSKKSFIDLYDNDLYGLKQTIRMSHSDSYVVVPNKQLSNKKPSIRYYQWHEYIDYFRASYYLGTLNYKQL